MHIFNLIAPLFLIIVLGYVLKKIHIIDEDFGSKLNRFVYYVALPFMLFSKTSSAKMDFSFSLIFGYLTAMVAVAIFSLWLSKFFKKEERGALVQGSFRSNLAYIGIPVVLYALGDEAMGYAAIIVAIMIFFHTFFTIAVFKYIDSQSSGESWMRVIGSTIMDPLIISIVLGMLFSLREIHMPVFLVNTIDLIARMSLASILLIIGISLSFADIRKYFLKDVVAGGLKLICMPLFAYIILHIFFKASPLITAVTVIMAAMPTAAVSVAFVREFRADYRFAGSIVNFNTILSLITIPIVLYILGNSNLSLH